MNILVRLRVDNCINKSDSWTNIGTRLCTRVHVNSFKCVLLCAYIASLYKQSCQLCHIQVDTVTTCCVGVSISDKFGKTRQINCEGF